MSKTYVGVPRNSEPGGALPESSKTSDCSQDHDNGLDVDLLLNTIEASVLGELEIDKKIGAGGYGSVYRLRKKEDPQQPPRYYALKVFRDTPNFSSIGLAKREIASLKAISCDRIPPILHYHISTELTYYITNYFEVGSLEDKNYHRGEFSEKLAWKLLKQLSEAVRDAHAQSILHLDIKPANILLDVNDDFYLTDFGVSQASLLGDNPDGIGLGTRGYRSPEQVLGVPENLSMKTDLFGIGITLWYLLTGLEFSPSLAAYMENSCWKAKKRPIPSCTVYRLGYSEALTTMVDKLTNSIPGDRPASAADILVYVENKEDLVVAKSTIINRRKKLSNSDLAGLIRNINDPLLTGFMETMKPNLHVYCYEKEEVIANLGEASYEAFLLVAGRVRIERGGEILHTERREGVFLGEVSTLTFQNRTADIIADCETFLLRLDASELEEMPQKSPALAVRLMRELAERVWRESDQRTGKIL